MSLFIFGSAPTAKGATTNKTIIDAVRMTTP
jgi:hypothetical protein